MACSVSVRSSLRPPRPSGPSATTAPNRSTGSRAAAHRARARVGRGGEPLDAQHDLDLDAWRLGQVLLDVPGPVGRLGPRGPLEGDVGVHPRGQTLAGDAVAGLPGQVAQQDVGVEPLLERLAFQECVLERVPQSADGIGEDMVQHLAPRLQRWVRTSVPGQRLASAPMSDRVEHRPIDRVWVAAVALVGLVILGHGGRAVLTGWIPWAHGYWAIMARSVFSSRPPLLGSSSSGGVVTGTGTATSAARLLPVGPVRRRVRRCRGGGRRSRGQRRRSGDRAGGGAAGSGRAGGLGRRGHDRAGGVHHGLGAARRSVEPPPGGPEPRCRCADLGGSWPAGSAGSRRGVLRLAQPPDAPVVRAGGGHRGGGPAGGHRLGVCPP